MQTDAGMNSGIKEKDASGPAPRVLCFIPEFPGQTHIWLWREVCGMRDCGLDVRLGSTRPPDAASRAKHTFAEEIEGQVFYTWPLGISAIIACGLTAVLRPIRTARCVDYSRSLARDGGKGVLHNLKLIIPAIRLASWCRTNRIDHIHSATPANSLIIAHMASVYHPMTTDVTINANFDWWGGAMTTKLSRCNVVFVITDWMVEQIRREYRQDVVAKTHLARIGIDTQVWTNQKTHDGDHARPFKIVSVGRLHPFKGHDDLIRAVSIVADGGLDVRLEIAGSGPDEARLRTMIEELGLADRASLVGSMPEHEVRKLMGEADVFVAASHAEPLGVVYMEAMSTGTVVIGTDAGGAPEIIEHDVTGLLVPPKSPDQLAEAIFRVLSDRELRTRLGTDGSRTVRERFDSRVGASVIAREVRKLTAARR